MTGEAEGNDKDCVQCKYCYMEPDANYPICGHPMAGSFGKFVKLRTDAHCGEGKPAWEQHELRKDWKTR